jgi:hypothetical protein
MTNSLHRLAAPLPRLLRTRPRDKRGYPIPFVVLIDRAGLPQFTINDARKVEQCRRKHLCGLCGKRMDDGFWFVGGARCFTHPHGAFVDPPNHYECAEYALRVCPFLAAPNYGKRIDLGKMTEASYGTSMAIIAHNSMPPAQPERFGLGQTSRYRLVETSPADPIGLYVVENWQYLEWWRNGEPANAPGATP